MTPTTPTGAWTRAEMPPRAERLAAAAAVWTEALAVEVLMVVVQLTAARALVVLPASVAAARVVLARMVVPMPAVDQAPSPNPVTW